MILKGNPEELNKSIKLLYKSLFKNNSKQLRDSAVFITKSLLDNKAERIVEVDYVRLKNELIYYKYYGEKDENILSYMTYIPIFLANRSSENGIRMCVEISKNMYSWFGIEKNYISMTSCFVFFTLVSKLLERDEYDYFEIVGEVKDALIKYSPEVDKKDFVGLQKYRVEVLSDFFKIEKENFEDGGRSDILDIFKVLYCILVEEKFEITESDIPLFNFFMECIDSGTDFEIENSEFIDKMSDYIVFLRDYRVNRKKETQKADPRYLIGIDENAKVSDPVLNVVTVEEKILEDDCMIVRLSAKSGIYNLKFRKKA